MALDNVGCASCHSFQAFERTASAFVSMSFAAASIGFVDDAAVVLSKSWIDEFLFPLF